MATDRIYRAAVLIYNDVDILDFSGPTEFLSQISYNAGSAESKKAFRVELVGAGQTIRCGEVPLVVTPDCSLDEAIEHVSQCDVLVVPGARVPVVRAMISNDAPELQLIKAFTSLPSREDEDEERIVLSVCTGALLLAATGALSGMPATTHHTALDVLKQLDGSIQVQSSVDGDQALRYVDAGVRNGVRYVTGGGVTCGMDAALYVGELKAGFASALYTAKMNEYCWNRP